MNILNKSLFDRKLRFSIIFITLFLIYFNGFTGSSLAQTPSQENFDFTTHRNVNNGYGSYQGFTDSLISSGTYVFTKLDSFNPQVHATYSWKYSSNQGDQQTGSENRYINFDNNTRMYTSSQTDLDDYDSYQSTSLYIWFKIPTDIKLGDSVPLLDNYFTVTAIRKSIWFNNNYIYANELAFSGSGTRNDSYGVFTYTFTATYYFDPNTGFVISENYHESDTGTSSFLFQGFSLDESFTITSSSYALPVNYFYTIAVYSLLALPVIIIIAAIFLYPKYRWRTKKLYLKNYNLAVIQRIHVLKDYSDDFKNITDFFEPFINDFFTKALISDDKIVEVTSNNKLIGLGFYNKEADLGTIFTKDVEIKHEIRQYLNMHDFFTELRKNSQGTMKIISPLDVSTPPSYQKYGLIDIYQILKLNLETSYTFDTSLIREMKKEDLPIIINISNSVNDITTTKWIESQFNSGDIGIVAYVHDFIVGFAFASISGNYGRLHTLTVLKNFQNQGIGKQLMKARLKILYDLGITTIITEIANWNIASLQIAYSHGFTKAGELYIETNRSVPRKKGILRV